MTILALELFFMIIVLTNVNGQTIKKYKNGDQYFFTDYQYEALLGNEKQKEYSIGIVLPMCVLERDGEINFVLKWTFVEGSNPLVIYGLTFYDEPESFIINTKPKKMSRIVNSDGNYQSVYRIDLSKNEFKYIAERKNIIVTLIFYPEGGNLNSLKTSSMVFDHQYRKGMRELYQFYLDGRTR